MDGESTMVKRVVVKEVVYECEVCGFGYSTKEAAGICEMKHKATLTPSQLRKELKSFMLED